MRLSYLIAQHRNKSLEPFVATSQLTNEFANHPVYLDMQLSSLPHKQLISLAISARGLKSTTIFRQKERNQAPTAGRKGVKNNKKSTAIVSDDSAIGVDESFDFTGDTPTTLVAQNNVFDQQRRFEAKLQQAGDPIALSVNFLPFRFVKGEPSGIEKPPVKSSFTAQIAAELPFFLKRQGSLLSQFSGCPSTSSIFRRRQYINDQGEEVEDEEVQAKPKLTKRFTDSNLHQYVRQKVNEELAIDQRQKFNKQRRSLDSFDENLNNNIDGKRVSSLLNNKLESALGAVAEKSKKKKKPLPKSSSSIAFSFAPSATNILASKKQQQVPNLAQPNGGSRLRSQSTSSSTTAKQSPLRKTLSPVPERRRKLRQSYSKAQKKPQHQQSQQNYTTNTTSSSLKRFDATPIKSRSYSPLLVRRRPSPKSAQTQPTKRRQLVRSSTESVDSPKQLKQKSQSKSKKATQRVKQSEKSVQAPETPVPAAKVDKVEELKKEVEKEEELKVEELNEYFEERFKERFKKDDEPQAQNQASPVTSANKENEPRESTASTKPVEDEQCPSKSPTESRNSATKSPAVDSRKKFLFRALFADESEDESLTNQGEQVIEACTLDGRCVLMTLNRDGSVCAPGATMLEDTEVVQLNVGGSRYTTTKATLTSREPESFFSQLLQADEVNDLPEPWRSAACRLDTGAYFIDRDGELFAYVLDFLRNGKLLLPENFKEISRLREETLFYQLEGMHGQIMPYFSMRYPARNGVSHANGSSVTSALETGGFITLGYRGTFAFGRDGQADVKFRKLHRILVCGKAQLCREVFGDTLNESRDPDREGAERYTSRLYLKHQCLEKACDNLAEKGFKLITASSSGANGLAPTSLTSQGGAGSQIGNPALRLVLAAPQQWKSSFTRRSPDLSAHRSATALNILTSFGSSHQPPKDFMAQRNSGDFEESRWAHYTEYVFYREPQIYPSSSSPNSPRN